MVVHMMNAHSLIVNVFLIIYIAVFLDESSYRQAMRATIKGDNIIRVCPEINVLAAPDVNFWKTTEITIIVVGCIWV